MDAIYKKIALVVLISVFVVVFGVASGRPFCDCVEEGYWSGSRIVSYQKVSDFMIAAAYFSIPFEILYFVSCSNVPYKWVLLQFMAFISLCGLTHFLSGWTYAPHPFQLMLALTVFKFMTAMVSFATSITLVTLIPMLLKVKVRELLLKKKARDLGQEVNLIKKKKQASLHVRMLTSEIRKSLDRHTILYTTLDKLSELLDLYSCAVWTPNEARTEVCLTHLLNLTGNYGTTSLPTSDADVRRVKGTEEVQILHARSELSLCSGSNGVGEVAAVRMPMLRICNFNSGHEIMQECFAILVCILPGREWAGEELEILRTVADQVTVALSHAAILEESQLMRDKLSHLNLDLERAKQETLRASYAKNAFQLAMADGLRRPMHSIVGLVSMMQDDNLNIHKKLLVDSIAKTSTVLSVLINDVMESSDFSMVKKTFCLRSLIKEVTCISRCLCIDRGYGFGIDIDKKLPKFIVGDERRILQVILHMVGNLLDRGGFMMLKVTLVDTGNKRPGMMDGFVYVMFEVGTNGNGTHTPSLSAQDRRQFNSRSTQMQEELSFSRCRKIVEMMQGNIWVVPNPDGFEQSMALALKVQVRASIAMPASSEPYPNLVFHGLNVLLADHDTENRAVTRKLLERLGCNVMPVTSGIECLDVIGPHTTFEVILLDLALPDINSFEVAMEIRKFSKRLLPLILALTTSNNEEEIWIKCLEIGMNGVIQKPINLKGISVELSRALSVANMI